MIDILTHLDSSYGCQKIVDAMFIIEIAKSTKIQAVGNTSQVQGSCGSQKSDKFFKPNGVQPRLDIVKFLIKIKYLGKCFSSLVA
jgi:hypothetical protein